MANRENLKPSMTVSVICARTGTRAIDFVFGGVETEVEIETQAHRYTLRRCLWARPAKIETRLITNQMTLRTPAPRIAPNALIRVRQLIRPTIAIVTLCARSTNSSIKVRFVR